MSQLKSLYEHKALERKPEQSVITYDQDSRAFYCGSKIIPGLTKQIEDLFCHHNFHRISLNGVKTKHAASEESSESGPRLGNRIDREMSIWADQFQRAAKNVAMGWDMSQASVSSHWHPYTKALIKYFVETMRWAPVKCQVVVGDPVGVATKIDGVFEDEKGDVHLVEFKHGYNRTFKGNWPLSERAAKPEKWLTGDLDHVRADALNLALIEIYWGELLWTKTYVRQPKGSYVAHVHDGDFGVDAEVELYGAEQWLAQAMQRILSYHQSLREKQMDRAHVRNVAQYEKEERKQARAKAKELKDKEKELKKQMRELKTKLVKEKHEKEVEAKAVAKNLEEMSRKLEELKQDLGEQKQKTRKPSKSSSKSSSSSSALPSSKAMKQIKRALKKKKKKDKEKGKASSSSSSSATRKRKSSSSSRSHRTKSPSASSTRKRSSSTPNKRSRQQTLVEHNFPPLNDLYRPRQNVFVGSTPVMMHTAGVRGNAAAPPKSMIPDYHVVPVFRL